VRRTARSGVYTALDGAFSFHKPSSDVGLAAGWQRGNTQVEIALTALDYVRQPYLLRSNVDFPLGHAFRVEGHLGVMRPATLRAYVQAAPDSGFVQDERYGFAGGLVEWLPSTSVTAGGFATLIRAVTDRAPLPNGGAVNDYRLTERTAQVGARLLVRPASRWLLEGWLGRVWRAERRVYPAGAAPDVNYEDVAWSGQAVPTRSPKVATTARFAATSAGGSPTVHCSIWGWGSIWIRGSGRVAGSAGRTDGSRSTGKALTPH